MTSTKNTTEPEEVKETEENEEKIEPPELKEEVEQIVTPEPKKKPATKKKPTIVEIPVDKPEASQAASSTDPVAKARGRPKGSLGAKKREPQPEVEPAPQAVQPEITLADVLRHTRMMQEARRNQTREKYKSWVV